MEILLQRSSTSPPSFALYMPPKLPPQAKRFAAWVARVGGATAAAEILGSSVPTVSRLANGLRRPGLRLATRIQHYAPTCKATLWAALQNR